MYKVILTAVPDVLCIDDRYAAVKFIQAKYDYSLTAAIALLRKLQEGHTTYFEDYTKYFLAPYPLVVHFEEILNDSEIFYKEQVQYRKLCELGADGNAEAAIAYCKAEINNKISRGARG